MSAQELAAESIERKIERSSFGTPAARRSWQRTSPAVADEILAVVEDQDQWNGYLEVLLASSQMLVVEAKRWTESASEGSDEPAHLAGTASWKKLVRLTKLLQTLLEAEPGDRDLNDANQAVPWVPTAASKNLARRGATHDDVAGADRAYSFDVEAFYARNVALARAACRQVVRDPDAVDDIVHDVFVEVLGQQTERVDEEELSRWLQGRVRGRAWRHLRDLHSHQRRTAPIAEVGEQLGLIADPSPDPGELLVQAEQRALVHAALQGLSADDQQVLTLGMQGLTSRQLAEALEVPVQLIHVRVHRARQRLLASLGALLVARRGPAWCEELAGLLQGWDGQMQPVLRKRIVRHVQRCASCRDLEQLLTSPEQVL
jgi:RNA polymerase sigma factor (sigma-70 family)